MTKVEHLALKELRKNKNLVIQKADKGNAIVVLNREDYISKMGRILGDNSKFSLVKFGGRFKSIYNLIISQQ